MLWAVTVVAAATSASACGGAQHPDTRRPADREAGHRVVLIGPVAGMPVACGPRAVALRIAGFFDAFNTGDRTALQQSLTARRAFAWFSSSTKFPGSPRRNFVAHDPGAAVRYLLKRHAAGERLSLLAVNVTLIPPTRWVPQANFDIAGVEFALRRTAPDLHGAGTRIAGGKAGLACAGGRIVLWSMGLDRQQSKTALSAVCPSPSKRASQDTIVACSRRSA